MQVDVEMEQGIDPDLTVTETADCWIARVSVADALYLIVVAGAAIMRFTQLGDIPLSPAEAKEALATWQVLQPGSMAVDIGSPAYFTLTGHGCGQSLHLVLHAQFLLRLRRGEPGEKLKVDADPPRSLDDGGRIGRDCAFVTGARSIESPIEAVVDIRTTMAWPGFL